MDNKIPLKWFARFIISRPALAGAAEESQQSLQHKGGFSSLEGAQEYVENVVASRRLSLASVIVMGGDPEQSHYIKSVDSATGIYTWASL